MMVELKTGFGYVVNRAGVIIDRFILKPGVQQFNYPEDSKIVEVDSELVLMNATTILDGSGAPPVTPVDEIKALKEQIASLLADMGKVKSDLADVKSKVK